MNEKQNGGIAVGAGEGERIRSPLGGDVTQIVRGEHSNGALAALEAINGPGEGPPLHVHTREDETVYVLEGQFRWKLGDELSVTGPGSFVFIPRGVSHTWQVIGEGDGRMLVTFFPDRLWLSPIRSELVRGLWSLGPLAGAHPQASHDDQYRAGQGDEDRVVQVVGLVAAGQREAGPVGDSVEHDHGRPAAGHHE